MPGVILTNKVIVIGTTDVGRRTCADLEEHGYRVVHLDSPSDHELRECCREEVAGVAVMLHDDIEALRYCLAIEHIRPGVRMFVAIFDRSVRHELEDTIPNCFVASPAYVAIPSLVAAALADDKNSILRSGPAEDPHWLTFNAQEQDEPLKPFLIPRKWKLQKFAATLAGQFRSYDSASFALLASFAALLVMGVTDMLLLNEHMPISRAFYSASSVLAGVTSIEIPESRFQLILSGIFMLLTVVMLAIFGAGMVNHILTGRRVGIAGRRIIPSHSHIVVAGLGQVGIRLCKELKLLNIPVVGIEANADAPGLALARELNIPVLIGNASDVRTLRRARIDKSRALMAMSSREQDNISVAVAARAISPNTRVVLRAGSNYAIEETQSLFAIGRVCDVNGLTARFVSLALDSEPPLVVTQVDHRIIAVRSDSAISTDATPGRCAC